MRPRCLIEIVRACQSTAVTLEHERALESDIKDGLEEYSVELATNIGLEIADVYPGAPDVVFELVGVGRRIGRTKLAEIVSKGGINEEQFSDFLGLLLWYGVLGLVDPDGKPHFIYDHRYKMKLLEAVHSALPTGADPIFQINPAFWPALEIDVI